MLFANDKLTRCQYEMCTVCNISAFLPAIKIRITDPAVIKVFLLRASIKRLVVLRSLRLRRINVAPPSNVVPCQAVLRAIVYGVYDVLLNV